MWELQQNSGKDSQELKVMWLRSVISVCPSVRSRLKQNSLPVDRSKEHECPKRHLLPSHSTPHLKQEFLLKPSAALFSLYLQASSGWRHTTSQGSSFYMLQFFHYVHLVIQKLTILLNF